MTQTDRGRNNSSRWPMAGLGSVVILSSVLLANGGLGFNSEATDGGPKPTGYPQLVSVEPLPEVAMGGEMCAWVPAPSPVLLAAALRQERSASQSPSVAVADRRGPVALNRPPVRVIRDPYPTYSAVAVDPKNNEIVLQDETGKTFRITASLGLAYYPADDVETPEDLVHSADGALYGAKRSGKNRYTAVRPVLPLATA